jgi:hypothetical protein
LFLSRSQVSKHTKTALFKRTMFDLAEPPRRTDRRYRAHGLTVSLVLHVGLVAALTAVSWRPWWFDAWAAREAGTIHVTCSTEAEQSMRPDETSPEVRIVSDPADVTSKMLQTRLDEVVEDSKELSDEEKLARLDRLSDRLTQVSSEDSINAVAGALQTLLGAGNRAVEPAEEPVGGDFDFDTAQFHDIQRSPKEDGGWRYVSVLLDAEGRTIEVEMNEEDGELVYETMERIKASPLLAQVYRQIAMPLFDRMLAGMRGVAEAADQLDEAARETQEWDDETTAPAGPDEEAD